jgi:hypothetical protein
MVKPFEDCNAAMLLGDGGIPKPADLRRQAEDGVRVFLAAYGGTLNRASLKRFR